MNTPSKEALSQLVLWPAATNGAREEEHAVRDLVALCQVHGFGRISQLATQIEDLWRNPEREVAYGAVKKRLFAEMEWKTP